MNNELNHHGILGQKWGVRRYQNKDGSLTKAGKIRYGNFQYTSKDSDAVNDIYKTLSVDDKKKLMGGDSPDQFTTQKEYDQVVASFILQHKDTPISAFDVWSEDDGSGKYKNEVAVSVLTRSGDDYRNKGYASDAVNKGMEWLDNNPEITTVYWDVRRDNKASISLAKRHGFEEMPGTTNPDWTAYWKRYNR